MSSTSASNYSKPYANAFDTREQFDEWITRISKVSAASHAAAGLPIVDFRTETPNTHLSTKFRCNHSLTGRLTPYPHDPSLYVLDFIANNDIRFERDTNFVVYDVGDYGEEKAQELEPMGSMPGKRGAIDMFVLNPGRVVEVRRRDTDQLIKKISFVATSFVNNQPHYKPVL